MGEVAEKLAPMLAYWLEHNREHEEEFLKWADRATPLPGGVAAQLRLAAENLAEASRCLEKAQKALEKKAG